MVDICEWNVCQSVRTDYSLTSQRRLLPREVKMVLKGITTRHYINFFCCIYMKYTIKCNIWVCLKNTYKYLYENLPFSLYYDWSKTLPKVTRCCMFQACYRRIDGRRAIEGNDGPGVHTDFILYVSAKNSSECASDMAAYAAHCQLEQALDR